MVIKEFKHFVNRVWADNYNFITLDLTKKKNNSKHRKNLDTIYFPSTDPFI